MTGKYIFATDLWWRALGILLLLCFNSKKDESFFKMKQKKITWIFIKCTTKDIVYFLTFKEFKIEKNKLFPKQHLLIQTSLCHLMYMRTLMEWAPPFTSVKQGVLPMQIWKNRSCGQGMSWYIFELVGLHGAASHAAGRISLFYQPKGPESWHNVNRFLKK